MRSWTKLVSVVAAAASAVLLAVTAAPAQAAVWQSSDRWGTWSSGGYTLYNNIWGSGYGSQTIWANSPSTWGVWADHPNTGGIKAYPNATRYIGRRVSALGTTTSSFNVSVPTSGVAFTTAYDIWSSDNAHEIMLWMNKYGPVGPLGSLQTTTSVGGHTWSIYRGSNGANQVYSFVRTSNTSSGTVDVRAIAQWIRAQGWFGDVTIGNVQFGYEITSAAGGKDFVTNSFSVSG
jgi:Glycosyl hydrolase family 12